jgi:hypothetical protein
MTNETEHTQSTNTVNDEALNSGRDQFAARSCIRSHPTLITAEDQWRNVLNGITKTSLAEVNLFENKLQQLIWIVHFDIVKTFPTTNRIFKE